MREEVKSLLQQRDSLQQERRAAFDFLRLLCPSPARPWKTDFRECKSSELFLFQSWRNWDLRLSTRRLLLLELIWSKSRVPPQRGLLLLG